jgi:type II secretory pathway pseudopilin PulG
MKLNNHQGFTIVETLIGLAVIGFLVLIMGEIQSIFSNQNIVVSQRIDYENLKIDIRSVLYSKKYCKDAFTQGGGLNIHYTGSPVAVDAVKMVRPTMPSPKTMAQVGQVTSSGVRIDSITMQPVGGAAPLPNQKIFHVEMLVKTSVLKGPRKGDQRSNLDSKFKFYISMDQSNEITECALRGEELTPGMKGCDRSSYGAPRMNTNPALPSTLKIVDYGFLPNDRIDDGGNSGADDDALFYCTIDGSGLYGTLTMCLSKENCPWK